MNTVFILGDSIMKGVIFTGDSGAGKYKLYGDNKSFDGLADRGIEVMNRSRMGATITYAREKLGRLLGIKSNRPEEEKPDNFGVIFEYGGNDCDYKWTEISADPTAVHQPNVDPDKFRAQYNDCIVRAKERGAQVALTNLVPIDADKYFSYISRGLSGANILSWLGDVSMLYRWQEYYSSIVEEIARKNDCPLIDLRGEFLRSHNYKKLIGNDGIHPTAEGHKLARSIIERSSAMLFA